MKRFIIFVSIIFCLTILISPYVQARSKSYIFEGMGIGAGIGFGSGAAIGGLAGAGFCRLAEENKNTCYWQAPVFVGAALGTVGLIVGTIIGASRPKPESGEVALMPEVWFDQNQGLVTGLRANW